MLHYLGLTTAYPFLRTFNEIFYHVMILISVLVALYMGSRRFSTLGYSKKKTILFFCFTLVITFPAGFIASRAATMFYRPMSYWSFESFFHFAIQGGKHTYHASIIVPAILLVLFFIVSRFKLDEGIDTVFLYVPLGHAIGRLACLVVGCCWGRHVFINFFGLFSFGFRNPIPLYAILLNIVIFLLLRRIYETIYYSGTSLRKYGGSVIASYFILYGIVRLTLEIFRTEPKIAFHLTQAQIVASSFICTGAVILLALILKNQFTTDAKIRKKPELRKYFIMIGFLASYMVAFFILYRLMRELVLPWPFTPVDSIGSAYMGIAYYLPVLIFPAIAFTWLKMSRTPILQNFKWTRFSSVFYPGLALSLGYTFYLLVLREPSLRGIAFWPPVIILSIINAFSEELTFRQGFFHIFREAGYSAVSTNVLQSLLYSITHFALGSAMFGILSFFYGLLLGSIRQRNDSIVPVIMCHFLIDIGCIGFPMLSVR